MSTRTDREDWLRDWLTRVVGHLLAQGGSVANALVETTAGKEAVIQVDDARLRVRAHSVSAGIELTTELVGETSPSNFKTDALTLREVMNGCTLLDKAIVEERIYVRATLDDLVAMHDLVLKALAMGPRSRALRELWREFDDWWPSDPVRPSCTTLDQQLPAYGQLRECVPDEVLTVRLDVQTYLQDPLL